MVDVTFTASAYLFQPLSAAEIDQYSIKHFLELSLQNWSTLTVEDISNGWPDYEELRTPGVYVLVDESSPAPYELGSHAKRRSVFVHVFGENDAQRTRLADQIEDYIRDIIPIYDYVNGNETNPAVVAYFETDRVGWRKLPTTRNAPEKEKWRAVVTATLRRVVA